MKLSELLAPMLAAGIPADVILATVRAFEDGAEQGKEKARERWRRWKNKQGTNVGKRLQTDTNVSKQLVRDRDARVEDNLQTKSSTGQKENKKAASLSDLAAFKADLEQDASAEQVDAFAKHRKTKSGQNSAYAAKLFRKDAAACGLSVSQAIDTAISRGWLTVKPEYLAGRQQRATAPPPSPPEQDFNSILDAMQGKQHVSQHSGPTIEASYERGDRSGSADIVQFHAFSARS